MSRVATRQAAVYRDCPGIKNDGKYGHAMRDHCWSCAPFWERIPTCPEHGSKLTVTGYCKACRRHYLLED